MTMEAGTTPLHRNATSRTDGADEAWPRLSWRVALMNRIQDCGVDIGWRLKNAGLTTVGLWLVHSCRRKNSITI